MRVLASHFYFANSLLTAHLQCDGEANPFLRVLDFPGCIYYMKNTNVKKIECNDLIIRKTYKPIYTVLSSLCLPSAASQWLSSLLEFNDPMTHLWSAAKNSFIIGDETLVIT